MLRRCIPLARRAILPRGPLYAFTRHRWGKVDQPHKFVECKAGPALHKVGLPAYQAVKVTDKETIYVSGVIGVDEDANLVGGLEEQANQVFKTLDQTLRAAGSSFKNVVRTNVYLTDLGDFELVNAIYRKHFKANPPVRDLVAVSGLPLGAKIQISCVAHPDPEDPDWVGRTYVGSPVLHPWYG